jgi:hypothetical protein
MFATLCLLGVLQAPLPEASLSPPGRLPGPPPKQGLAPVRRPEPTPAPAGEWLLIPQLPPGQELIYKGMFTEQATGRHMLLNRTYRLETRVFVLDVLPRKLDVAVLTLVKDESTPSRPGERVAMKASENEARSAHLERLSFDGQGRATPAKGVSLSVPLEGPPTLECGFCVPVPSGRLGVDRPWTVAEADRPETTWKVTTLDIVSGVSCVRMVAEQKSADWDHPRSDHVAWRRQDVVWVSPRTGFAQRVERCIEHRPAGYLEPTHLSSLTYDLQSSLQYPADLSDNRRREITQTDQLQQSARALLAQGPVAGSQLDTLILRAKAYIESQAQTPYREALVQLRERMEAARRGETPPPLPSLIAPEPSVEPGPRPFGVGKPAPDFIAGDMIRAGDSVSSRALRGKPVLMVFFNPDSHSLDELMTFVHDLAKHHKDVAVLGLVLSGGPDRLSRMKADRRWTLPILNGAGLKATYAVDCTPRMVMLDADGVVQGVVVGWGDETDAEVRAILPRWLRGR